jgi:hypothetical protein
MNYRVLTAITVFGLTVASAFLILKQESSTASRADNRSPVIPSSEPPSSPTPNESHKEIVNQKTPEPSFEKYPESTSVAVPTSSSNYSGAVVEREGLPPSNTNVAYVDSITGISIKYPDNWFVDRFDSKVPDTPSESQFIFTVRNFDDRALVKREWLEPSELKIDVYLARSAKPNTTLDDYLQIPRWHPDTKVDEVNQITINGITGIQRKLSGGLLPNGAIEVLLIRGELVLNLLASPANSAHIKQLDAILSSLEWK